MANRIPWHEKYKVDLPEAQVGDWRIERHVVNEAEAEADRLRSTYSFSSGGRFVPEGTYTGLLHGRSLWMSDTPDEIRGHMAPIHEAHKRGGHVLINGLGLGVVAGAILGAQKLCKGCNEWPHQDVCACAHADGSRCPKASPLEFAVEKVTVIERSPEVVELVGPSLVLKYGRRLEVIMADAYEYRPPKGIRYTVVWHDIWLDLCTDNLEGMGKLHRKYGRRTDWQGSWEKDRLLSHRRREKARGW